MNQNHYSPSSATALILSADPLLAALLGAAVELSGCAVTFSRPSEAPREAIRRLRPALVLFDCTDSSVRNENVLGPAMMVGAKLFVFGSAAGIQQLQAVLRRYKLRPIVLPRDIDRLKEILALEGEPIRTLSRG